MADLATQRRKKRKLAITIISNKSPDHTSQTKENTRLKSRWKWIQSEIISRCT
jgi:hypothetical protein